MRPPDPDADNLNAIEIDANEDLYSLKRALWTNQTLLIKILDEQKKSARYLESISYWVRWLAFIAFAGLAAYAWLK